MFFQLYNQLNCLKWFQFEHDTNWKQYETHVWFWFDINWELRLKKIILHSNLKIAYFISWPVPTFQTAHRRTRHERDREYEEYSERDNYPHHIQGEDYRTIDRREHRAREEDYVTHRGSSRRALNAI